MSCIFCDIVQGKVESYKIAEDESFIAILDLYPNTKGQALVITKKHYPSDPLELPDGLLASAIVFAKEVAEKIRKRLNALRVFFVIEGMEVGHFHIKLYPIYKIKSRVASEEVFFEAYPGYLSTLHGPKAKKEELEKIKELILRESLKS